MAARVTPLMGPAEFCPRCGERLELTRRPRGGAWGFCGLCWLPWRIYFPPATEEERQRAERRAELRRYRRLMLRIASRTADPEAASVAVAAARGFSRWLREEAGHARA
jgi:hypothetical protein